MRHALVEGTKIVNVIEIDPRNASDFKNAVTIPEDIFAGIGDTYRDGRFYRINPETQQEEEILPMIRWQSMRRSCKTIRPSLHSSQSTPTIVC